jgi:hypothetical protein
MKHAASDEFLMPANGWWPRTHQMRLWQYLQGGGDRAVAIWHRRAGKDEICLHHAAMSALKRVGNYWHCLPEFKQARKAIWTSVNAHTGRRRIDEAFPPEIRANCDDNEMFIRFHNGSTFQCIGSDRYDAALGAGPAGITYSEYATANPSAWAYHRPMLQENGGWAVFITTPRGHNHAKSIFEYAEKARGWFAERLTAEQTGALSEAELSEALSEYQALYGYDMGTAAFEQEYNCSFNAAIVGAFYAREMADVRNEGRITERAIALPDRPVHRAWDLGVGNDTSIWWFQMRGAQLVILDHYAASGVGVEHYAETIAKRRDEHGWIDGYDFVPHDANVKEWGTGRTRIETMTSLGLHPKPIPMATIDDGINAVRRTLPLCVFHPRCEAGGISALEQYRREWDDDKKCFKPSAYKDWTTDPADAFRYLAQAWKPAPLRQVRPPPPAGWVLPPLDETQRGGIVL